MLKSFRLYFFILFLILYNSISGQTGQYSIEHYSIDNGLSQNFANSIFQDKYGYIWIATQGGLNRYDGYEFVTYRQDPNNKNSLSSNYVIDLANSKDTTLWIVTNDGLEEYNYKTNSFKTVIKNKENSESLYSTSIKAVHEDEKGILWLRTLDGIIRFNPKKNEFLEYKQASGNEDYVSDYNYFSILEDSNHNLWSGSKNGLIQFNNKIHDFQVFKFNENSDNNEVFSVHFENKNKFWVGTGNGVYTFNPYTKKFNKIQSKGKIVNARSIYKDKQGIVWIGTEYGLMYIKPGENIIMPFELEKYITSDLTIGNVFDIIQDNSGIIWVTSDYGVFKIDSKKKHFNLYKKDKNNSINFSTNTIFSIFYDSETNLLWLGTRGFGLNIFDRKTNYVKTITKDNSPLNDNNIHCIVPDENGNVWLGTNNGPFIYDKLRNSFISFSDYANKDYSQHFKNNRISNILFDGNNIWFSTLNGLIKYNNGSIITYKKDGTVNSIISNDIFKTIKRKNGEIWIATLFGLSKFDTETGKFTNYTKDNNKISDNAAITVFESSDQTLWVGTGTGLDKYIPEKDSFVFYTAQSHGFRNDFIYTISEDNSNNLWLSTNKGISKFNTITEEVINFSEDDNLQGYEFNIGANYSAKSINEIFWGGINGLNSIKLKSIKKNLYAPVPIITKFVKSSQHGKEELIITGKNEVFLTHKESSFDIHFAVPEYTHPHKNSFKYKIEEAGNDWIDLGTKNSINFFQLSPGDYTFKLIGSNSDNSWNPKPIILKIHISSPWWQTIIAYIFYIILFIFIVLGGFFFYNKEIRKENKILHDKQIIARKVEKQKELLSIKNNSISESMRYASRIIDSLLPSKKYIKKLIPDSFVLFMSKEIVSGDFYWVNESEDKVFAAAVDCTGHGVPGAFMSIIGLDILRNIIDAGIDTPGEMLDRLNHDVAAIFRKDGFENDLKDGMDISIVAIHKNNNFIEFAGAINQMFLIRDDNIVEIKGTRYSISPITTKYGNFKNHTIEVKENDMIYLFSDGYVDQFGGPDEKKFKYRRFRHMLLNNYKKPLEEQKNILKRVINSWRGQLEQVDDILVMGIRIHEK